MIGTTHHVSTAPPVRAQSTAFIMASMATIEDERHPDRRPECGPEIHLADQDERLESD